MKKPIQFLLTIGLMLSPQFSALAQEGLVACAGPDCQFCSVIETINNVVEFVVVLAVLIATLMLAYSGFQLVFSQGNAKALQSAKKFFINTVIGIIIILFSYTAVDTVLKIFVGDDFFQEYGPWNEISCAEGMLAAGDPREIDIDLENRYYYEAESPLAVINSQTSIQVLTQEGLSLAPYAAGNAVILPRSSSGEVCYQGTGSGAVCLPAVTGDGRVPKLIDVDSVGSGVQLSPNFSLGELNRSATCGQGGDLIYLSPYAVAKLEEVRARIGTSLYINSGYRSPSCNETVGGASHSRHMYGDAFDIHPPGGRSDRQRVINACCASGADYVATYESTSHVHCDWRGSYVGSSLCN